MQFEKEIKKVTQSNNHLIYICTTEEERLENILKRINKKLFDTSIYTWDFIEGYKNQPNSFSSCQQNPLEALLMIEQYNVTNSNIFILKDFHFFLNDISINRKIKNLYQWLKKNKKYVFLSGTNTKIPNDLEEYITFVKLPLPNEEEIRIEVQNFFNTINLKVPEYQRIICKAYKGFSIKQIRTSLFKLLEVNINLSDFINQIVIEKSKNISNIEGLKFYRNSDRNITLGGLNKFKKWLNLRNLTFSTQANAYGIKTPKGVLLVGIQGTGKSLSAQTISNEWNLPLLKLDIGRIFASTLGESESRIEKIIEISTAMAPCILWVDEIDKVFIKQNNTNDSGTTQRVTNIFLTWLSEKKDEIFIIATANKINQLPTEMLRKGRFDEIFFVDLPIFKDRMSIFQLHLKRFRPVTWNKYNIYYFCKISNGFSGAEIEQSIINAMYTGFHYKREFTSKDIILSIQNIIPLSKTHADEVASMRQWGYSGKAKLA